MTEKKAFLDNTLLVLAANFVALVFAFFSRPLIARFLGPSEYGVFALILGTASVIPTFTLLSLNSGVLFFVSRNSSDKKRLGAFFASALSFVTVSSVVLFVPSFLVVSFVAPSIGFVEFAAASVLAYALCLLYLIQSVQQGIEDFKWYSFSNAFSSVLSAVFSVAAALVFFSAVSSSLLRAFAVFVVAVIGIFRFRKFLSFDFSRLRELFGYSTPLAISAFVGTFIAIADRYVLAGFHSTASVGIYDIASSLTTSVLPFVAVISNVMSPKVIRTPEKIATYFEAVSTASMTFLTCFALGLYYLSEIAVTLLLGSSYAGETVLVMRILALSLPLVGFYSISMVVLTSVKKTVQAGVLGALLVMLVVLLNLALVPSLASSGSAYANVLSYFLIAVLCALFLSWLKLSLGSVLKQLCLFALFVFGYLFFSSGFVLKIVGLLLFGVLSVMIHLKFFRELFELAIQKVAFKL